MVGQDWLPAWAAAGFIAPLDDVAPAGRARRRSRPTSPASRSTDVTYDGKVYGLPYYADTISFIYNKKILEDAGIAVPTTWDEVTAAAEKLKAGGMDQPIVYEYDQELPNFFDAFVAQSYGRGGDLFDADLQPALRRPGNGAYKQLAVARRRLQEGPRAAGDARIEDHPGDEHRQARLHHRLHLRARRAEQRRRRSRWPASSRWRRCRARRTRRSASPSPTSSPRTAAADPARAEAAWKFVNFMAGKPYTVAKRWAVEKGLGFGQLPLFDDPGRVSASGASGPTSTALGEQVVDRQGRHLDRVLLGLVGLFPAAAGQGDGRRGHGRRGDEGRRRSAGTSSSEQFANR